jgi:hypothetical protein
LSGAAVLSRDGAVRALARQTSIVTSRGVPLGLGSWAALQAESAG